MTLQNEVVICKDRDEWLQKRSFGVGASEVAAVMGLSPWDSALSLYYKKRGLAPVGEQTERMSWGLRNEDAVARWYNETTGRAIVRSPWKIVRATDAPMLASLDAEIVGDPRGTGPLEIKCTRNSEAWTVDGPPEHYKIQLQAQLAVTGYRWGALAVLICGDEAYHCDVAADLEQQDKIVAACRAFWKMVEDGTPPAPDGSDATREALKRLHPGDNGETVMLPPEAADWIHVIELNKAQNKETDAYIKEAENKLIAAIGPNTYGKLHGGGKVSYKTVNRAAYEAKASTYRQLRIEK